MQHRITWHLDFEDNICWTRKFEVMKTFFPQDLKTAFRPKNA